jgi:hypothetical protein
MTDPAPPLIEPDEAAFPPCAEGEAWARAMIQRELEVLGEMAELGLRMARAITDQATGEATTEPVIQGDLPLAFSRASRAVRMAVLLQAKLIQDIKTGGRKAAPSEEKDEDECPVNWEVYWLDSDGNPVRDKFHEREEPSTERRDGEACERLERDDIYAAVMGRPKEEVIARIREDLGVADEVAAATSPSAVAMGRGGPHADPGFRPGEERVVVGAGQAHHATASPISDSS